MSHRTPIGTRAPSSKLGRNKHKCKIYREQNRRETNKLARAARILRGFRAKEA